MKITIKNSRVTIQETVSHPVSVANILRTSYEKLKAHAEQHDESGDRIRQIVEEEMKVAVQKAASL